MSNNNLHTATNSSSPPSDWVETTLGFIPNDWTIIPAEDFCIKVADGTHDSPKQSTEGKLLITSKNIKNGQLDVSSAYLISLKDFEEVNKRSKVDKWDILLSMIGTVGEVCLISQEPDFAIKNVGLFKCGNESNAKWLYYFLRSNIGQNHLLSRLSGTTQKYITLGELRNFPIIKPTNPNEQQAIASVLSAFDDKIELLREQNKTLEEMGQMIFKEWFGKYSLDDELPEGWRVGKLGEIDFISFGDGNYSSKYPKQEDFVENGIPFISNKDISNGVINPSNLRYINQEQHNSLTKGHLKENDILISTRANIGDIALVSKQFENANINAQLVYIRTNNPKLYAKFLYIMFSSKKFKSIFESFSSGSAQSQLPMHALRQIEIKIPNKEILEKFSETVNPIFEKISDNNSQIQSLARSRDELLPRLMRGEVRVKF